MKEWNDENSQQDLTIGRGIMLWLGFMIIVIIGIPLIFGFLEVLFTHYGLKQWNPYVDIIREVIGYIIAIRFLCRHSRYKVEYRVSSSLKEYLYVLAIIIGFRLIYDNTMSVLLSHIPVSKWVEEAFSEILQNSFIGFISICVIAPVFEEIVYRGIFLREFAVRYGEAKAILISSLFFAIMHMNIHQGVNAIILGAVLGFIYVKTDSLILCMIGHFINNAYAAFMPAIEWKNATLFIGIEIFVGIILFLGAVYMLAKRKKGIRVLDISG